MAKRENEIDKYLSFAVSVYGFNISAYEKINASNRKFKKLIYLIDKKYVLYFVEKKMFSVNYFKYYPLIFNSMIKSGIEIPKIVKGIDQNEFYYFCNYFCYLVTYLDYPTLNDIVDDNNSALIQMYKFIGLYSNNNKELLDIDFPSILNIDGLHKVCSRVTEKRQCCLDICNELKKMDIQKHLSS